MRSTHLLTKCCSIATTLVFVLFALTPSSLYALPEGGSVQAGSSTISTSDSSMHIHQASQKAIINWNSYNIAGNESVNYHQPSASALSLNRVTGGSASDIFGALNANGRVWLLNPSGIMFGPDSSVNTGGLLATNLNISNSDFLNNKFIFSKTEGSDGYVINKGTLSASDGGYISLLGDSVRNEGIIHARLGKAILAGGEKMTLEMDAQGMISVAINDAISRASSDENDTLSTDAVSNTGTIEADGGSVVLTASVLGDVFENAVNNAGLVKASSLVDQNGEIYLLADGDGARVKNTGVLDVSASETNAAGGYIEICADTVSIDGRVYAQGSDNVDGEVYIDPWDVFIRSSDPGVAPGDSYISESFLESSLGSISIDADNDVSFSLVDSSLDLDGFGAGTSFNVSAGRHIDLNDTFIETSGGSVFLRADDIAPYINGEGDVILDSGSGIKTDGGDIGLYGANISLNGATLKSFIDSSGASVDITIEARMQSVPSELEVPTVSGADISIVDSTVNAHVGSNGSSRISINTDNGDIDISGSFLSSSVGGDGTADLFVSGFTLGDVKGFVDVDNSTLQTHVGAAGKAYTNIEGKNDVTVSAASALEAFSWTDAEVRVESVNDIYMSDSSVLAEVFAEGDAVVNINLNPWYEDRHEQNTIGDFIISNTDLRALVGNDGTAEVIVNGEGDVSITDDSLLLAQIGMGATTARVDITSNYGNTITIDDSELLSQVLYTNGVALVTLRSDYNDSGSVIVKNGARIKAITADGAPETGQDAFVGLVGHTVRVEDAGTQLVALNNGDGSSEVRLKGL
jgi:filamentous hemagglutinin family protein